MGQAVAHQPDQQPKSCPAKERPAIVELTREEIRRLARLGDDLKVASLIAHSHSIAPHTRLCDVQAGLDSFGCEYVAVVEAGRPVGMCSRHQIDELLGARNGIGVALFGQKSVGALMVRPAFTVETSSSVAELLRGAFSRQGSAFFEDVLVVDHDGGYLGMILVRTLIELQDALLQVKIERLHGLTEELQASNQALAEARDTALAATRARSSFLANMSHEIRTPMNGVIGITELLATTPLNAEQQHLVQTIRTSGESLLSIINDILDFSKIESGLIEMSIAPVEIEPALTQVVSLLWRQAAGKGLTFSFRVEPGLRGRVLADPVRLQQVLLNLAGNAVKFTSRGEVFILAKPSVQGDAVVFEVRDTGIGIPADKHHRLFRSFSQVDGSTSRRYGGTGLGLAISARLVNLMGGTIWCESEPGRGSVFSITLPVADESAGGQDLTDATRLRGMRILVVDREVRWRETVVHYLQAAGASAVGWGREDDVGGPPPDASWGIVLMDPSTMHGRPAWIAWLRGLPSSVRRIALGARDHIAAGVLRGAGVSVFLQKPFGPRALMEKIVREFETRFVPKPGATSAGSAVENGADLRVLVAEDHEINQMLIRRMLQRLSVEPDLVDNGVKAVAAVERHAYDLVFMDIQMPEMDGEEAARVLRSRLGAACPFIVALTANAMAGDRERYLAAGMDDHVSKPVRSDALASVLAEVRQRKVTRARRGEKAPSCAPSPGAAMPTLLAMASPETDPATEHLRAAV